MGCVRLFQGSLSKVVEPAKDYVSVLAIGRSRRVSRDDNRYSHVLILKGVRPVSGPFKASDTLHTAYSREGMQHRCTSGP